ncbi:hypothetical protein [Lysobacter auxotrophicus]|uniref:DUF4124 domain-containing protein n=1 Tax=Lysobacter auxotrophicus TaxID=2992573 RepID=A0ABM8DGP4_9GAMM|nr:hypothetical protein [Lysobacter auxotrophicus]BDU17799.1 DUF4124 domain-containing protein [Lysobacter auxotrophicus]
MTKLHKGALRKSTPKQRATASWIALLALLCAFAPAHAAGGLHRCEAPDGSSVYTDSACAAFDAKPAAMSTDLLNRLASDDAAFDTDSRARSLSTAIRVRRAPQAGCARSPTQLSMDLLASFAMGDVNRIAESVHWPGLRHRQAQVVMNRLMQLARASLVEATFWPGLAGGGGGAMQLTFDRPQRVMEVGVERYAGCYFVRL